MSPKTPANKKGKPSRKGPSGFAIGMTAFMGVLTAGLVVLWFHTQPVEKGAFPSGTKSYDYVNGQHTVDAVTYTESPAVGGPHKPQWQACDAYQLPVDEMLAVHSLEHGAVWLTYRPDLSADRVAALEAYAMRSTYVLISPYPGQTEDVVASAWNHQLRVATYDAAVIEQFVEAMAQGPQTPEPGAPCREGGIR
jgi:hypothetical protein